MLHDQFSYKGDGIYLIEGLSEDDSDFSFADIENSLLEQDFIHKDLETGNQTTEVGLLDLETSTSIKYDFEEDTAKLYFTELSPTKEKVLDEALTAGHVPGAFSLRELYRMETDPDKDVYQKGTEEYYNAWNK
ncbi:MAG: hypothetical protein ACI9LV_001032 [Candidatus Nanohaloarchaea archaeon]|jgi:hypothetical protein